MQLDFVITQTLYQQIQNKNMNILISFVKCGEINIAFKKDTRIPEEGNAQNILVLTLNVSFPQTTILFLVYIKFMAVSGAGYHTQETSQRKDQDQTWQMDALFPPHHSGMQLTSDEVVRLPAKGSETDLFYLKRLRT